MFATVRRYEGIDASKMEQLKKSVDENLAPTLSKLPGFSSYFLIDTGNGVMSSVGVFETWLRPTSRLVSLPSGCATRSSRRSSRIRRR